jgi:hypothetical protein
MIKFLTMNIGMLAVEEQVPLKVTMGLPLLLRFLLPVQSTMFKRRPSNALV